MRLTQNEIIQAQRKAERGSTLGRMINAALTLLPRPIRRWVVLRMAYMAVRAMMRRGYTEGEIVALFKGAFDSAQRKKEQ